MSKFGGEFLNRAKKAAQDASRIAGSASSVITQGLSDAATAAERLVESAEQAIGAQDTYTPNDDISKIKAFLSAKNLAEKQNALEEIVRNRDSIDFLEMKTLYSILNVGISDTDLLFQLSGLRKEKEADFMTSFLSTDRKASELFKLIDSDKIELSSKLLIPTKLDASLDRLEIRGLVEIYKDRSSIEAIGEKINDKLVAALEKKLNGPGLAVQDSVGLFLDEIAKDPKNEFLISAIENSLSKRENLAAELMVYDNAQLEQIKTNSTNSNLILKLNDAIEKHNLAEQEAAQKKKEQNKTKIGDAEQNRQKAINYTDSNQAKEYVASIPKAERLNFLTDMVKARVNGGVGVTYGDLRVLVLALEPVQTAQNFVTTILADPAQDLEKEDFVKGLGKIEGRDLVEVASNADKQIVRLLLEAYGKRDEKRGVLKQIVLKRNDFSFADYLKSFPAEVKLDSLDIKRDFILFAQQMDEERLKQFVRGIDKTQIIGYISDKEIQAPVVLSVLNTLEEVDRSSALQQILPTRVEGMDFEGAKLEAKALGVGEVEAPKIAAMALLLDLDNDKKIQKIKDLTSNLSTDKKIEFLEAAQLPYEQAMEMNLANDYEKFAVLKNFVDKMENPARIEFIKKNTSPNELIAIINYGLDKTISETLAKEVLKNKKTLNLSDRLQMEALSTNRNEISAKETIEIICDHYLTSQEGLKMTPQDRVQGAVDNIKKITNLEDNAARAYFVFEADEAGVKVPRSFIERVGNFVDRIFTSKTTREKRAANLLNQEGLKVFEPVRIASNANLIDVAIEEKQKQKKLELEKLTFSEIRKLLNAPRELSIADLNNQNLSNDLNLTREVVEQIIAERRGQNLDQLVQIALENVAMGRAYGGDSYSADLQKIRLHSEEGERRFALINEVLSSNPQVFDANILKRMVNTAILETAEENLDEKLKINRRIVRAKNAIEAYINNPIEENNAAINWEIERVGMLNAEIAKMIQDSSKTTDGLRGLIEEIDKKFDPEVIKQKELEAKQAKRESLEGQLKGIINDNESLAKYSKEDQEKIRETYAALEKEGVLKSFEGFVRDDSLTREGTGIYKKLQELAEPSSTEDRKQNLANEISAMMGLKGVEPIVFANLYDGKDDKTGDMYRAAKRNLEQTIKDSLEEISPKVEEIIQTFSIPDPSLQRTVGSTQVMRNLFQQATLFVPKSPTTTPVPGKNSPQTTIAGGKR